MAVEVLYRKYRPQRFSEVAGQDPIMRTLRNAVAGGKVSHAYLFNGPRGTGKTSTGRLLAKAVNCLQPQDGEPCNECDMCRSFLEGRAMDLVELDAASNRGIDDIRDLREKVGFAPAVSAFKTYIIDEVHMLTESAFNALLKTLEEPPPHIVFVLATTEPHKIPATIASRCQRFDFRRIPLEAAVDRLAYICEREGITCPREALELIARTATGSLRDSINLLEQVVDYHGRELSVEAVQSGLGLSGDARSSDLAQLVLKRDLAGGLALIASVRDDGQDLRQFQREVVSYLRQFMLVAAGAENALSLTKEQAKEMKQTVEGVAKEDVLRALRAFGQADLRADPLSPLPLELALAECALATKPEPVRAAASPPAHQNPIPSPVRPAPAAAPVRPPAPSRPADPMRPPVARKESPAVAPSPPAFESSTASGDGEPPFARGAATLTGDLAQFQGRWREVYQLARQLNQKTGALLNSSCTITGIEDNVIIFGFRFEPLAEKMNSGEGGAYIQALHDAVQKVLGPTYDVRCVFDANSGRTGAGGHLVQAAQQMGARIIGKTAGDGDEDEP